MRFDWSSLKEKKGPLPVWAWALILSFMLYFLYRHFRNSMGTSSGNTSTDLGTSGDLGNVASLPDGVSGGSGAIDTSGDSFTPVDSLPETQVDWSTLTPWWVDPQNWPDNPTDTATAPVAPLASGNPTTVVKNPAIKQAKPIAKPSVIKSIIPGITGIIKTQKVTPLGTKIVTLESGRVIEQAKGKSPYVAKPGKATASSIRYYTYKKDVPLGGGKTVHFTPGKGYYAA